MLIAQITDTHILEKDKHLYLDPSTQVKERLSRVVSYINSLNPLPDVVLLTGDATDEGTIEAYEHLIEILNLLKVPYYVIPGNHDRREVMRGAFQEEYMPQTGYLQYAIDFYPVRLIGLDTLIEGEGSGVLCMERLEWLVNTLKQKPEKPTLLFMHHPPVKNGVKLFDELYCDTPPQFEELIQKSPQVIGILSGHYHHLCMTTFGGKMCLMAPSVAPVHYIAHPEDNELTAIELEDPAVALHEWREGKFFTTHIRRVKESYKRLDWKELLARKK